MNTGIINGLLSNKREIAQGQTSAPIRASRSGIVVLPIASVKKSLHVAFYASWLVTPDPVEEMIDIALINHPERDDFASNIAFSHSMSNYLCILA